MNKLEGTIVKITTKDNLSLIDIQANGDFFTAIIITSNESDYLNTDEKIFILFKETEVSIGKNLSGALSIRNRIKGKIKNINRGVILSKIELDYKNNNINSIITTRALEELCLKKGDTIEGLIKTNEISIMKV